jgi:hypothetical protein
LSTYNLQKLIRGINRSPDVRAAWFKDRAQLAEQYGLDKPERDALVALDIGALYRMGVHGLLLRPFTIIQGMSEVDYLAAIRAEALKEKS